MGVISCYAFKMSISRLTACDKHPAYPTLCRLNA